MGQVAYYIVAQMIGAMLGAFLSLAFRSLRYHTDKEGKLAFSTIPAIQNYSSNLISEIIRTFVLICLSYAGQNLLWRRHCKNRIGYHWCIACSHLGGLYIFFVWLITKTGAISCNLTCKRLVLCLGSGGRTYSWAARRLHMAQWYQKK
jgi:glycerol uptake facilitator-like aquaporin